jgi:hypothetical protein
MDVMPVGEEGVFFELLYNGNAFCDNKFMMSVKVKRDKDAPSEAKYWDAHSVELYDPNERTDARGISIGQRSAKTPSFPFIHPDVRHKINVQTVDALFQNYSYAAEFKTLLLQPTYGASANVNPCTYELGIPVWNMTHCEAAPTPPSMGWDHKHMYKTVTLVSIHASEAAASGNTALPWDLRPEEALRELQRAKASFNTYWSSRELINHEALLRVVWYFAKHLSTSEDTLNTIFDTYVNAVMNDPNTWSTTQTIFKNEAMQTLLTKKIARQDITYFEKIRAIPGDFFSARVMELMKIFKDKLQQFLKATEVQAMDGGLPYDVVFLHCVRTVPESKSVLLVITEKSRPQVRYYRYENEKPRDADVAEEATKQLETYRKQYARMNKKYLDSYADIKPVLDQTVHLSSATPMSGTLFG